MSKLVLILSLLTISSKAMAHVKWFSPYSVEKSPTAISELLATPIFWILLGFITISMITATWFERRSLSQKLLAGINALTAELRHRVDDMMRVGMGVFLIALWILGEVILTPELKTDWTWVSWFQLAMALALFWRWSMPLTSLGILFLWCLGVWQYGLFHLLDYPIFLGIAIYLTITACPNSVFFPYRWDVLRWGAAITLMWASIEKFAYPDWSFPILEAMPSLTLGLSKDHFMMLAGLAEFALAFALIWTPLVRRLSAVVLCALFLAAIIPFGKIDAIGHLMIILILIGIIVDDRPISFRLRSIGTLVPLKYASLIGFTVAYYGLQTLFYGDLAADSSSEYAEPTEQAAGAETRAAGDDAAQRLSADYPDPILKVWSERGDDGSWRLFLYTENFIIGDGRTSVIGDMPIGHAHVYLGEEKLLAAYTPIVDLGAFDPGVHRVSVVLKSTNHRTLLGANGPIEKEIVLNVPDPRP